MPDNKRIILSEEDKDAAIKEINELQSQTGFLAHLISTGAVGETEARTHLDLLRHNHDALAKLLKCDTLSKALDDANARCRAANSKIRDLQRQLGMGATADASLARLHLLEDWFRAWYGLCGFHYLSLSYAYTGISFDSSSDIDHEDKNAEGADSEEKGFTKLAAPLVPYAFTDFDLRKDTFHDDLLDTQKNREGLIRLFQTSFPGARIHGFQSRRDGKEYLLRVQGTVPWSDIEKWHDGLVQMPKDGGADA